MRKKYSVLLLLLLSCLTITACKASDADKYSQAQKSLNNGEFEKAVTAFQELGEYEDSAKFNLYALAQSQLQSGESDKAIKNFENLGDFKSSALFVRYAKAAKQQSAGEYAQAIEAYRSLGDFKDSAAKTVKAQLAYGTFLEASGDFALAISTYQALENTPQIQERIEACKQGMYASAQRDLATGQYRLAYDAFLALGDYKDAVEKAKEAYEGVTLFAAKDERSSLWGFMDASLTFVIPPMYDSVDSALTYSHPMSRTAFDAGYEVVCKDRKYTLIDKKGKLVLPGSWDDMKAYPSQNAFVVKNSSGYGLIDCDENFLIPPEWDGITLFSDSPECYIVKKNVEYGIVDRQGNVILPLQEYEISTYKGSIDLSSGFVIIEDPNDPLEGLVSLDGKIKIPPVWNSLFLPEEGICVIRKEDRYGAINLAGDIVINPEWDDITHFTKDLLCARKGEQYQMIDPSGNPITTLSGKEAVMLNDSLFAFWQNESYIMMNRSGQTVGHERWEGILRLSDTLFAAEKNAQWGIIDANEQAVLPFEWDEIIAASASEQSNVLAIAKKGHAHHFFDRSGALIPGETYDYASAFQEGLCRVLKDGKFGCLNEQIQIVIPLKYDLMTPFQNAAEQFMVPPHHKMINVSLNGLWGRIDLNGETIIPIVYPFDDFLKKFGLRDYQFSYDCAPTDVYGRKHEGKLYLMNMKDEMISDIGWDYLNFAPYGIWGEKDKKRGLMDYQGKIIFPPVYDNLVYLSDGLFSYRRDGICGIADMQGKETSFPELNYISSLMYPFVFGSSRDYKIHLYDLTGKEITFDPLTLRRAGDFHEGLAQILLQDENAGIYYIGYINTNGEVVMKWEEDLGKGT